MTKIDVKECVQKYFEMDPKTEDLLFDGTHLRNGMTVLIEDPEEKQDFDSANASRTDPAARGIMWRARKLNRWCTVSNLLVEGDFALFVGIYEDGGKMKRMHEVDSSWFVKKDSIPAEEPKSTPIIARLHHGVTREVIRDAIIFGRAMPDNSALDVASDALDKLIKRHKDIEDYIVESSMSETHLQKTLVNSNDPYFLVGTEEENER